MIRFVSETVENIWEEKMLVSSIFSFSQNVFKYILPWGCAKLGLCDACLTLYHTVPPFNNPEEKHF